MQRFVGLSRWRGGERALEYLARYLYRGVVREEALTQNPDGSISLRYIDSSTDEPKTRNFQADVFLRTYLKHTLPKGFRRARDYGFLHRRNRLFQLQSWLVRAWLCQGRDSRHCQLKTQFRQGATLK